MTNYDQSPKNVTLPPGAGSDLTTFIAKPEYGQRSRLGSSSSDFIRGVLLKQKLLLILILAILMPNAAHAQAWSGVLDPSRGIDWSQAGAGTIPTRTTICSTPSLQAGSGNAAANGSAIRNAIIACPAGQVVSLPGGTWSVDYISFGIYPSPVSNVTLRGAGPNSTDLIFTAGAGCNGLGSDVCMINGDNNYSGGPENVASMTGGYSKGSTSITLGSFSSGSIGNLHVGSLLILDQADDSSDTGNVYLCQTSGSNGACSQQGGVGNGQSGRSQTQIVRVTSISGSTIGITPGVYASNWSSAKSPGVWFSGQLPITGDGLENMTLDNTGTGINGAGIMMDNAYGNWVKNVRDINGGSAAVHKHVWLYQSAHNTIRDSYFYGSNGASESYGVDSGYSSGDNLAENNICQHVSTCAITEGDEGTVFGYNYAVDDYYSQQGTAPQWQQEDSYHHSVGDGFVLWEGQEGIGHTSDDIHGTSFSLTMFRDYFNGRDPALTSGLPKIQQTIPMGLMAYSREHNVIGNVLGTTGYHNTYTAAATSSTDCGNANANTSIYVLGYSGDGGTEFAPCTGQGFSIPDDTAVATTLYRWGNCDAVNGFGNCQFNSSEVPSSVSAYAQAVPSSHTLPNSFYLPNGGSSAPPFWNTPAGAPAWPAVGPDVTGGNMPNVGGRVAMSPAAYCYLSVMGGLTNGSSGLMGFDANTCYYSGAGSALPVPLPPTNLSAVPH
jgi:hypothetical protein